MKTRTFLIAGALGALGVTGLHGLVDAPTARAQSTTTGAIQGQVVDSKTGEKLAGVTITASSGAAGAQSAITDENGFYKISPLVPGEYLVTFYYLEIKLERSGVVVGVNKVTPVYQKLDQGQAGGEVVRIIDSAPTIDPTSTTQGITIDKNYLKNIPVPGRTFESALGAAAGSQGDALGVSFSGSTSLENQYYVDGVNTTGLTFGTVGSPIINDFIEEIEVITGGYNAEFGRSTGGIVNVVTKSGSNEFKGSIFGYYQPGQLTYESQRTPVNAASIDVAGNVAYNLDFGFEVGGPIVKDKLWFFAGFVPAFRRVDYERVTKRQTDCRQLLPSGALSNCDPRLTSQGGFADGTPDVDPATGFFITDDIDRETRSSSLTRYNILGKINYAATPENQGQLAVQAQPVAVTSPSLYGPAELGGNTTAITTDVSAKWTSKFNDNKTEIEAVVGWHRDHIEYGALNPALNSQPLQILRNGDLFTWGRGFMSESQQTLGACEDNTAGDVYPNIANCPMNTVPYYVGGPGNLTQDTEERRAARIGLTQRVKAAGSHEFKAGMDVENNLASKTRLFSGGGYIMNFVGNNQVLTRRWVQLAGLQGSPQAMDLDPRFDNTCRTPDPDGGGATGMNTLNYVCDYLSGEYGSPGTMIEGNTLNWSAYIRDSWQIQPNLTLNAGLRYEEQRLRYAGALQNRTDPLTGEELGKNAMTMSGMFAPRVGLLYDWTKEGRSKVYTHWGRFYESIPMQINDRSFGGETLYQQVYAGATTNAGCMVDGMPAGVDPRIGGADGTNCLNNQQGVANSEQIYGASGTLVAPGIKPQYMDEIIFGFEYEILDDLKIGVNYQNRRMGRVIEDVSTDGANTYIIANPGEWSAEEERKFQDRIDRTDDPNKRRQLENQLALYQGIRIFDKPIRNYNALQFTLTRRFSKKLYVQGSYSYTRTIGNYPGLFSPDNGQVDPNISSQYDLIELLANRIGPLPQDRPHYIKLDGYYTFDFKKAGDLTIGARLRALSGVPINALGAHYLYGGAESFLLPRGQLGRTDFEHGLDMHFGYAKALNNKMKLEFFVDLFNIYNRQGSAGVDDVYAPQNKLTAPNASGGTLQNANPVSGGTYEDLIFVKTIDQNGVEGSTPIGKNPNFRNTNVRYAPGSGRLGLRLTF